MRMSEVLQSLAKIFLFPNCPYRDKNYVCLSVSRQDFSNFR